MKISLWCKTISLFTLCFVFSLAYAECDCPKFAFVNIQRIYSETQQAIKINANLEKEFAGRRGILENMRKEVVDLQKQFANDKNAQHRDQLLQQLNLLQQRYLESQRQFEEDYSLRRIAEFSSLQQRANKAIADISQRDGYDWISDNAVLVDKKYDITDKVIDILNGK
ncbi:MAG: OmpH family outer membrane protein [Neisseriaceae bacterium]|nr:OmpH family outer membrane protein [Neisseriaceae bacterium]